MEFHPIANIFPLLSDEETQSLAADIKEHGQRDLALLFEHKLLDGRNRSRACTIAGMQLRTKEFKGTRREAMDYVWSTNFHRRHLTPTQSATALVRRSELDAEFAKFLEKLKEEAKERQKAAGADGSKGGRGTPHKPFPPRGGKGNDKKNSRETGTIIAKTCGTSATTVAKVKKILAERPDMAEKLTSGALTASQAEREIKETKRQVQREADAANVPARPTIANVVKSGARFPTIVIDPPWDWGDEGDVDQMGRAKPTYATMSIEEITALPIGELAGKDAHLYLWITNRSLPKGFALLDAWGFRYVTCLTWCKSSFGMGNYFRGQTEHVLFGIKGSLALRRKDAGTVFHAPRGPSKNGTRHSSKPTEFYGIVESCSPKPWVEVFSRNERDGWVSL